MSLKNKATQSATILQPKHEPLAVVGIGCRLPGGINSPQELWNALLNKVDGICDVPPDRWNHERFHDTNPEKSGTIRNKRGGFIKGVDQFDAEFFGYFPTEAQRIDPQQRILLEVTHEAMEDAGLRRDQLSGTKTSVFVGSFAYDYMAIQASTEARNEINSYVVMGTDIATNANRISHNFNLKGPSVSLDTACSSSLISIHLACKSLWDKEAELAIAGGVNMMLRPETSIMLSKGGFLNPDQYCKAFDASANGYVRSEGCGIVILKPLSSAIKDGDRIYAVVRGTAVNHDGFTPEGITVPNADAHQVLIQTACERAGVAPGDIDYVEAHGTGTPVGDPIETRALGTVIGRNRPKGSPLLMGSIKTNLGHLEGTAGVAGFIKGALTAYHGLVVPNLHFKNPNPNIDFEGLNLKVPTEAVSIKKISGKPVLVGINSFGAGGANAHALLEAPPTKINPTATRETNANHAATLYTLSAKGTAALRSLAKEHAEFLTDSKDSLKAISYTNFCRRSHYSDLLEVVGSSKEEIAQKLTRFSEGAVESEPSVLKTTVKHKEAPKIGFIFSGQGGQWAEMGLRLMETEPVFRQTVEQIDTLFEKLSGWSLLAEMKKPKEDSKIDETVIVQPAVMAVQIALVKLYAQYGVQPSGVVGHSIGEVAAAFASGAIDLSQAVEVIYHRSQAQDEASGKGGMLAVGLSREEAQTYIKPYDGRVSIGAINGPEMLTLSGDFGPLDEIAEALEKKGVFNRKVRVKVPYHSHHIEPIRNRMLNALKDLRGIESAIALYSTVTGKRESGTHLSAEYWFNNARNPVFFTDALSSMISDGYDTFIEIGPHPVLVSGADSLFKKLEVDAMATPAMNRKDPEVTAFLHSLAQLNSRGAELDLNALFGVEQSYVPVPKYAWQHKSYWFETPQAEKQRKGGYKHPFLKRQTELDPEEGLAVWETTIDVHKFPYLRDHQVDGEIVFPATGHLELAWAVACEQFKDRSFFLEDLKFDLALLLPENSRHPLDVRLQILSSEGEYRISSRSADAQDGTPWSKHSSGRMNSTLDQFESSSQSLKELGGKFSGSDEESVEEFYKSLASEGLNYGIAFQRVKQLWHRGQDVFAKLEIAEKESNEVASQHFHPSLLDACLHTVFAGGSGQVYLPQKVGRVRFYRTPTKTVWSHVRVTRCDGQFLCSETTIYNEDGELIAEIQGMVCKRLLGAGGRNVADLLYEGCYEYRWIDSPIDSEAHGRIHDIRRAVLISDSSEFAVALGERLRTEGIERTLLNLKDDASLETKIANIPLDRRSLVLFAPQQLSNTFEGLESCPAVPALLWLAKLLIKREGVPRLCILTRGAAGVGDDKVMNLSQSILHGMARVIKNECPNLPVTTIDLGIDTLPSDEQSLVFELLHNRRDRDETEIAIRGQKRFVRQLISIDRNSAEGVASTLEAGVGGNYRADLRESLAEISFRRFPSNNLGDHDVEIAVEAAGLNFKDVMNAMGLLPEKAVAGGLASHRLGVEVSGRVVAVGDEVKEVSVGDAVVARVANGFSGKVMTHEQYVVKRPEHLTPIQAAAIPVVFMTAYYSLQHLAHMQSGDTVLIHSAAGGVGSAAIQLAQRSGAKIIATAGTQDKRDYLRSLGVEHVFDSRSLDFYNKVMETTAGRGVDIVLNFLTGRFIAQSLKCLAPFGRFIEIGKSDIYKNCKLGMEHLGENISYHVVDIDRLATQKPQLHREIFCKVINLFETQQLKPIEITEFPITRLSDAFKCMTRALYLGKIVLNMEGETVSALPSRSVELREDRSYLITGGASGFGLEVAQWMANRGAKHLVLASRSGCKTESDRAKVAEMERKGVKIRLAKLDLSDLSEVRKMFLELDMPKVAGIIHGAAVLEDASIATMDMARFKRVFGPKAQGAWNLHQATSSSDINLDFFVTLSSISSVLGLVGQVNYAASNFFQDALCDYRRRMGLPATSVNLGVLGDYAGMSKTAIDAADVLGLLESHGMPPMKLQDVLGKLEAAIIQQPTQRMTAAFDWSKFKTAYPHLVRDARFLDLMSDKALAQNKSQGGLGLRSELEALEPAKKALRVQSELASSLAKILDADTDKINVDAPLDDLGLDSLMLTQFRNAILRALGINLPMIKLLKGPSIAALTKDLLVQLKGESSAGAGSNAPTSVIQSEFTIADLEGVTILNPWLVRGKASPSAPLKLICFHSMGVGASLFTKFLIEPPKGYEVIAIQTPGRENRHNERVLESVPELVEQIASQLLPLLDRPFVLWGHSFGGIVAREVICQLHDRYHLTPEHLVVTGTAAPHLIQLWQKREVMLKAMVDENSIEYLISLSRYVDDPEFLKGILPAMRKDNPILRSYVYREVPPFSFPLTAFAARQDDMVYKDEVEEWAKHTQAGFNLIEVDGDHWFLNRNRKVILETLEKIARISSEIKQEIRKAA